MRFLFGAAGRVAAAALVTVCLVKLITLAANSYQRQQERVVRNVQEDSPARNHWPQRPTRDVRDGKKERILQNHMYPPTDAMQQNCYLQLPTKHDKYAALAFQASYKLPKHQSCSQLNISMEPVRYCAHKRTGQTDTDLHVSCISYGCAIFDVFHWDSVRQRVTRRRHYHTSSLETTLHRVMSRAYNETPFCRNEKNDKILITCVAPSTHRNFQVVFMEDKKDWGQEQKRFGHVQPSINLLNLRGISRAQFYRSLPRTLSAMEHIKTRSRAKLFDFTLFQALSVAPHESLFSILNGRPVSTGSRFAKTTNIEPVSIPIKLRRNGYRSEWLDDACKAGEDAREKHALWARSIRMKNEQLHATGGNSTPNKVNGRLFADPYGTSPLGSGEYTVKDNSDAQNSCGGDDELNSAAQSLSSGLMAHVLCSSSEGGELATAEEEEGLSRPCQSNYLRISHLLSYLHIAHAQAARRNNPRLFTIADFLSTDEHTGTFIHEIDSLLASHIKHITTLQNVATFILSDHGNLFSRYGDESTYGRLEQSNPAFFMILPQSVIELLKPSTVDALNQNQYRLLSVFDIHQTLLAFVDGIDAVSTDKFAYLPSLLQLPYSRSNGALVTMVQHFGVLRAMSPERTCSSLAVTQPMLCVCDNQAVPYQNDTIQVALAEFAIGEINNLLQKAAQNGGRFSDRFSQSPFGLCKPLFGAKFFNVRVERYFDTIRTHMSINVTSGLTSGLDVPDYRHNAQETLNVIMETSPVRRGTLSARLLYASLYPESDSDCWYPSARSTSCFCSGPRIMMYTFNRQDVLDKMIRPSFGVLPLVIDVHGNCLLLAIRHYKHSVSFEACNACDHVIYRITLILHMRNMKPSSPLPVISELGPYQTRFLAFAVQTSYFKTDTRLIYRTRYTYTYNK